MVIYITMREIYPIRFDYVLADSASYFATPSTLIIPAKGSLSTIPISDPYLKWRYYSVKEACTFTLRPYLSVHIILRRLFRRQILGDFMEFDFSETHSPTLVIVMLLSSQEEKKERKKFFQSFSQTRSPRLESKQPDSSSLEWTDSSLCTILAPFYSQFLLPSFVRSQLVKFSSSPYLLSIRRFGFRRIYVQLLLMLLLLVLLAALIWKFKLL